MGDSNGYRSNSSDSSRKSNSSDQSSFENKNDNTLINNEKKSVNNEDVIGMNKKISN